MQQSAQDNHYDYLYLVYLRNFILDGVEADNVFLQNQIIGQNHQTLQTIDPHIDLEKSDDTDKAVLNNFIRNEVCPWYLGLQNTELGSQARPNYIYKSIRWARNLIVVGNLVTPVTDPGDYIVKANGDLKLRAGDEIILKPGFYTEPGAVFHAKIQSPNTCNGKMYVAGEDEDKTEYTERPIPISETNIEQQYSLLIFPNPNNGNFSIIAHKPLNGFVVYNLEGRLIYEQHQLSEMRYEVNHTFEKGSYLLYSEMDKRTYKFIVL